MPALPIWFVRIPEILATLTAPEMPPVLDRAAVEQLFRLRRRQAIRLLANASGYQVGKTFIVDRLSLVAYLEGFEKSGAAPEARARKRRVAMAINEVANYAEAQRVLIPTGAQTFRRKTTEPTAAIHIVETGKLQITYSTAEDLLARVVELATAAANDFPAFRERYEGRP